ncbi:MAG: hypothetical protein WAK01_16200 [Methylocystis sp.]
MTSKQLEKRWYRDGGEDAQTFEARVIYEAEQLALKLGHAVSAIAGS